MLKNYLITVFKVMAKNKLFTFINLAGISLTLLFLIILSTIVDFSVGDVMPEKNLDRTLSVTMGLITMENGGNTSGPLFGPYFFRHYVKTLETPEIISVSSYHNVMSIYHNDKKIDLAYKYADSEFWKINTFNFLQGGPYSKNDVDNVEPVAVINEKIWEQYFDKEDCINEYMMLGEDRFRIIGIVENVSILRINPYADIWIPNTHYPEYLTGTDMFGTFPGWYASLLAKSKRDFPEIKAEFLSKISTIDLKAYRFKELLTNASTYQEALARQMFRKEDDNLKPFMMIIYGLILLFLLLPAINLANINSSRIMERAEEIGVRKAFGASSIHLTWQFLLENVIITIIGGVISLIVSQMILTILNSSNLIPDTTLVINYRVFAFSMIIALIFGLISGVYPAVKMSRLQPAEAITGGEND